MTLRHMSDYRRDKMVMATGPDLCSILVDASQKTRTNPDEAAIRKMIALWHSATAAGDVGTVLGLMSEDAVFLVAGQPPMRGRAAFERGLRGVLEKHRIASSGDIQEVEVQGDLAYCWSHLTVKLISLIDGSTLVRRHRSHLHCCDRPIGGTARPETRSLRRLWLEAREKARTST